MPSSLLLVIHRSPHCILLPSHISQSYPQTGKMAYVCFFCNTSKWGFKMPTQHFFHVEREVDFFFSFRFKGIYLITILRIINYYKISAFVPIAYITLLTQSNVSLSPVFWGPIYSPQFFSTTCSDSEPVSNT